jgi:RNA polymerase sigma-70 factor (ECF subfamily)
LTSPDQTLAQVYDDEWGRLLAKLLARTRRLDLVEDALGEAFVRAAERWPLDGVPDNPAGWLYTTAHRQVVGALRAEAVAARKAPLLAVRPDWQPPDEQLDRLGDEQLHLILLCCHPALPRPARSALALRLVMGTATDQIARLFLVPTATVAARLTRAKRKIVLAGIPLGTPPTDELRSRIDEVCRTIYLAFTAGYSPGAGSELLRTDVAADAVRLARVLHDVVPDAPQTKALLALLLLQHSRRDARQQHGRLVTLADQDRSLWCDDDIAAGLALVADVQPDRGYAEELRVQALIAAEHARAASAEVTNWTVIADYYATLEALTGSPVVRLNRAVAIAEARSPESGLTLLSGLDDAMPGNHRVAAVRGELARRAGDIGLSRRSFLTAIELCDNDVEKIHLQHQLDTLPPA